MAQLADDSLEKLVSLRGVRRPQGDDLPPGWVTDGGAEAGGGGFRGLSRQVVLQRRVVEGPLAGGGLEDKAG